MRFQEYCSKPTFRTHFGAFDKTSSSDKLPISSIHVTANIVDFLARVTLSMCFVNHRDKPLEVEYRFPLDPSVALCGFEIVLEDGRIIEGVVKEKQRAKQTYDDAVSSGHGAYLLERVRDNSDVFDIFRE